ncbi:hypothetical protein GsuE55_32470 [Geobacillus subterraneus]|uniref:Uncharacterized protein n=1 Tax=Geobacillus subterraneus TaxID=129338 RepID=A0A679G008_9BACL|nr:hypothetical protein GsuE55_32470 [Geobacillus subterraneus]
MTSAIVIKKSTIAIASKPIKEDASNGLQIGSLQIANTIKIICNNNKASMIMSVRYTVINLKILEPIKKKEQQTPTKL